jgi:ubiquitin-protein ligase
MASILQKRLPKELRQLQESSQGFRVQLADDDNITHWVVTLPPPPADSPYADGTFRVDVLFPPEYPHAPPVFRFITPIFSPSVDSEGRLCERMLDGWQPSQTALNALQIIETIFIDYTIGVVNVEAAKLAAEDVASFKQRASAHTKKYARQ